MNGRVYTDCTTGPGGFYASGSATVSQPAPSGFVEYTWAGEGGGAYGGLDPTIGAAGDPMSNPPPSQVAAPTFSPAAGSYTSAQSVTISTTTPGAAIRYTVDGSTPTATTGTLYSAPVSISTTTTLKAIAYASGMTDSTVTSGTYTITIQTVPAVPTNLAATSTLKRKINLSWTGSSGATSYNVKRATVSGGPYTTIATGVATTSYINSGLTSGTTYYYVVSAVNTAGESANSAQASQQAK